MRRPGNLYFNTFIATDSRKSVAFNANLNFSRGDDGNQSWGISSGVNVRPASNILVSFAPSFNRGTSVVQYVSAALDPTATAFGGTRYVLSNLRQSTLGLDTRISATFTPTLSLELYAQPFISAAHFTQFKEFAAPRSAKLHVYGRDVGTIAEVRDPSGTVTGYSVDPDGTGPATAISLSNPDFNLRSVRGDAVLRWEYRPGSTLYLVWTRDGSRFEPYVGDFNFSRDFNSVARLKSDNILMLKVSFWINR